jgi:FkbM family methyltransferase
VVYGNPPDYIEMMMWRAVLRPGDLFLDVGANIGSYAIWAAECGANVIALEPAEDTFALLAENISLNEYPVRAIRAAAGSEGGFAAFTKGRDCVNQLDPEGTVQIRVVTLDSVIGDRVVAGMKIDVEGFEIDVLLGCSRALAEQRIKVLQLEWNAASRTAAGTDRLPLAELLRQHGYGLYRPNSYGVLEPIKNEKFGSDVFALVEPTVSEPSEV